MKIGGDGKILCQKIDFSLFGWVGVPEESKRTRNSNVVVSAKNVFVSSLRQYALKLCHWLLRYASAGYLAGIFPLGRGLGNLNPLNKKFTTFSGMSLIHVAYRIISTFIDVCVLFH